jgi:adenylosuccinate synthase
LRINMTKKNVSIVVGLNAGSEAKGKLVSHLAPQFGALVRTGSINAAHTTYYQNKPYSWHLIPCGALQSPGSLLIMGAGAQLELNILKREIGWLQDNNQWLDKFGKPRLYIDPNATIIDEIDVLAENGWQETCGKDWHNPTQCKYHEGLVGPDESTKEQKTCNGCSKYPKNSLHKALGSTTHGGGYNLIRKMARIAPDGIHAGLLFDNNGNQVPKVKRACDIDELKPYLYDTAHLINTLNDIGIKIMLEGTQGAALSMTHSGYWPKSTSRDTNASNWAMEAGVSPLIVENIYGVTRTFPIRVFGNSGPYGSEEITWETFNKMYYNLPVNITDDELDIWLKDNNKKKVCEITTATKRRRRIFEFSNDDFKRAHMLNRPEAGVMLSFVDYLDPSDYNKNTWESLSNKAKVWVENKERELDIKFRWLSTGPDSDAIITRW